MATRGMRWRKECPPFGPTADSGGWGDSWSRVGCAARAGLPPHAACCCGETMKSAMRTPERSSLPFEPARLAVGLGLGSGPCERLPAPCAPSWFLAIPGGRFPRATAEEAAMTSADTGIITRVFSLSNRAGACRDGSIDCAFLKSPDRNSFLALLANTRRCFFIR